MNRVKGALAALMLTACTVAGAAFPDKPIRVVIGFPAGGPLDQHARLLSDRLQAVLGQPVIIDYKSGAGGTVGAQDVMKAAPDGYTLMLAYVGTHRDRRDNFPYDVVRLGSYALLDARIAYSVRRNIEVFARGSNLLGQKYQDSAGYRTEGTGLYAGVRLMAGRRSSR